MFVRGRVAQVCLRRYMWGIGDLKPSCPVRHAPLSDVCRSISVNGLRREVYAGTVEAALGELGYGCAKVATALNGAFLPAANRASAQLADGDQLEIVAARAGG